jgi:NAD(P)-dependent dehydrogenase (short-subunit alcohol dehydrogenase family)
VPEQVVLVTGSSSGIGRAIAFEAMRRGHRVFASARKPEDLAGFEVPGRVTVLPLDVTDADSVSGAVSEVLRSAGRIDALVNSAGYGQYGAIEDVSPELWRRQFDVNFFGTLQTIQSVLPAMREARGGTIVNVSSVAGKIAIPFSAPYCASKHALEALSDALRVEVAPFGIRVVVVEPGPIGTRFGQTARALVLPFLSRGGPYADFYRDAERAMDVDFQKGKRPPEVVARTVLKAIEAGKPKTRYRITPMARVYIPMRRIFSDRFFDRRMKKVLRLPDRV